MQPPIVAVDRGIRLGVDREAQREIFVVTELLNERNALLDTAMLDGAFAGADKENVEV